MPVTVAVASVSRGCFRGIRYQRGFGLTIYTHESIKKGLGWTGSFPDPFWALKFKPQYKRSSPAKV